jgi:micrococcal nuclease
MRRCSLAALALLLAGCAGVSGVDAGSPAIVDPDSPAIAGRITEVVDGDTLKVRAQGRSYTVRLIGIDTPETRRPGTPVECGGREATSRMLELAFGAPVDRDGDGVYDTEGGRGRRVTLRPDPTQDARDRYGRLLAYVDPGVQRGMLASGWATVYVYDRNPFQRLARFQAAERQARAARRGAWSRCGGDFHRSH